MDVGLERFVSWPRFSVSLHVVTSLIYDVSQLSTSASMFADHQMENVM